MGEQGARRRSWGFLSSGRWACLSLNLDLILISILGLSPSLNHALDEIAGAAWGDPWVVHQRPPSKEREMRGILMF